MDDAWSCYIILVRRVGQHDACRSACSNWIENLTTFHRSVLQSHTLSYLDFPGRAEAIRIMLHVAGVDFTDERISFSDWPTTKPTTPLGFLLMLTVDDTTFSQSVVRHFIVTFCYQISKV
jgi:hypothetical protein